MKPNVRAFARAATTRVLVRGAAGLAVLAVLSALGACAGSTLGSGVGDRMLDEPPYYAGRMIPADSQSFGMLPIVFQRGATQPASFEPEANDGSALAGLLAEMNAYLADSLRVGAVVGTQPLPGTAPDVIFRCAVDAFDECEYPESGEPQMRLAVARPSTEWSDAIAAAMDAAAVRQVLLITLEISDYWTYQRNFRGQKEVRLGAGNHVDVPWLTSLETPVSVLQLTGALVSRDGKAIRIGAEGLLARRSNILVSAIGGQALIGDEEVEALRTRRREDLAGEPLAWKVALRSLVANLSGRAEATRRR